jgi:hypothetical protein
MNRENLKLLADFLAKSPIEPDSFNMSSFHGDLCSPYMVESAALLTGVNYCGSAGCAVGWAPSVEELPSPIEEESFNEYSCRIFEIKHTKVREWVWMFSGDWALLDNTAKGAAARIYALLDDRSVLDGITPIGFYEFILPKDTSSYSSYLVEG